MAKRLAVPSVEAAVRVMQARLDVSHAEGLAPDQLAAADAVRSSLKLALDASRGEGDNASRRGPMGWWRRRKEWWHGTLVEASYAYLHAARVQMLDVYDDVELHAEVPAALARVQGWLRHDDPRYVGVHSFAGKDATTTRAMLRRLVEDGYDVSDRQHARLRSFRNIVLVAVGLTTLVIAVTVLLVWKDPRALPMCFPDPDSKALLSCPSRAHAVAPQSQDILVVALAGLIGGVFGAVVNIRNLRGTSASYDVPVALAVLKLPLGALTAIVGIVLVHGAFIPGLSNLDTQDQIVAYALLFGVAQQAFSRLLDQKAQDLLNGLPTREKPPAAGAGTAAPAAGAESSAVAAGSPVPGVVTASSATGAAGVAGSAAGRTPDEGEADALADEELAKPEEPQELLDNPEGDETDQIQDDSSDVMPDAPVRDHT
ncbi:hypothetical protein JCM18899A_45300 [Nocardioides sp. AN3]